MSNAPSPPPPSCWLSLEGGLLYAFVGPAAVIVLVCVPSVSWEGCGPGGLALPALQLPPGALPARSAPSDHVSLTLLRWAPGEYAHRDHRLQQAHGSGRHLRQVQETEGRVRVGVSVTWRCGKRCREGGLWPLLEAGLGPATAWDSLTLVPQGCRQAGTRGALLWSLAHPNPPLSLSPALPLPPCSGLMLPLSSCFPCVSPLLPCLCRPRGPSGAPGPGCSSPAQRVERSPAPCSAQPRPGTPC